MTTRVFALIIGIDKYKSGGIWNLESSVDDAKNIKHWLTHDLHVPRDQVCLLLDAEATKRKIEDKFTSHLLRNPAIEPGDAILVYFAGHGSRMRSPPGWFENGKGEVEMLCPYDHDTRSGEGRIAGISDRSLHTMLRELCQAKGDNVTLMLDTCFSPPRTAEGSRNRSHVRFSPTLKASPDDLLSGLWRSASSDKNQHSASRGFTATSHSTHVVFAACGAGWVATEGKAGGNFTSSLMALKDRIALHKFTYTDMASEVAALMDDHQQAVSLGRHVDRVLFDEVPFLPDARYVSVDIYDHEKLRIDAGAIHGIMEGSEFSIHQHNHRGSLNPVLATYSAIEVYPTWCVARCTSSIKGITRQGWARVTRWNNRTPFRVHIRQSLLSLFRRCHLRKAIPTDAEKPSSRSETNMLRVRSATQADMSVQLRRRELVVERHDPLIAANCRRIIQLPSRRASSDLKIIDDAARFHLHLHRRNPERPLRGLVSMEIFQLDASTWTRISGNLLVNGKAEIVYDEKATLYTIVLHNRSDYDLWPYLAYMDATGYGISMICHPDLSSSTDPPFRKHSQMAVGEDPDDSAFTFALGDGAEVGAGFLKLFVSSTFTPMTFIEQGPPSVASKVPRMRKARDTQPTQTDLWDSVMACITVVRKSGRER
ncbi:predicted protein [Postia placenta Mad-698-R]|nr:predicted protein [Postia placenta Mad-698-R]